MEFEDSNKALEYFNQKFNIKKYAKVSDEVKFTNSESKEQFKTNVLLSDFQDLQNV